LGLTFRENEGKEGKIRVGKVLPCHSIVVRKSGGKRKKKKKKKKNPPPPIEEKGKRTKAPS